MRKIFLVIAVLLLAAPAWATVSVTCTAVDPCNTYEVQVDYTVTDGNNIRAFGIRIDVNNGAVISNLVVDNNDYYIFPGSIVIDSNGDVNNWGSAVAEGGNGSAYLILEMGSLYAVSDANHPCEPPQSGILCTFETSKECVVTLSNDTTRGGVVMEDGSDYASLSGDTIVPYADCLSQSHPDWADYDAVGRPDCWCNPRQCHGDAANDKEGTTKLGYWYVGDSDLNILIPGWKIKEPPDGVGIATITGPNGELGICADFKHDKEGSLKLGYWYIGDTDLNRLIPYWKEKEVPDGNGVPADCL